MRKSLLLLGALCSIGSQAEPVVGFQEYDGQALLTKTMAANDLIVMSCTQTEEAQCIGQCAEMWCNSNRIEDTAPESRLLVRAADQCTTCKDGDLFLSHNIFKQLLEPADTYMQSLSVRWRCVDCGMTAGRSYSTNEQVTRATMHHGSESGMHVMQNTDDLTDQVEYQPIEDQEIRCSLPDPSIAGSSDRKGEMTHLNEIDGSEDKDGNENSNSDTFSSGSWSTSANVRPGTQQRKTVTQSLMSNLSSSNRVNEVSSPSPLVASSVTSTSATTPRDDESSSSSSRPLLSSSAEIENSISSEETTRSATSQDARATSTSPSLPSATLHSNQTPTSTTLSPLQSPDESVDSSLMATSSVTKSPFFYASIMLGIVGLIGSTVGYRAKQKRSYRNERRAFRMFAQTDAYRSNHRPAPTVALASWTRPNSHSIVIL